ncbi:MAG: hypothetical protein AAFR11_01165 [Pseudomonadota bacterium]
MGAAARLIVAYLLAAATALVAASAASTHFVLAGLQDLGADVTLSERLSQTWKDLVGVAPAYGAVIAAGFGVALPVGWLVGQVLAPIRFLRFPAAGAAAIGLALFLMYRQFDVVPIIGAQSTPGLVAQLAAGALGGLVFAVLRKS